jgi:quercetin dioxygenase-like cupin family protein
MRVEGWQGEIHSETLLRSSAAWNGDPYETYAQGVPELSVLRITIPPRSKLKWHMHPMPNVGYIVSGELTVQEPCRIGRRFVAGDVIPETVNAIHRGLTGDQGVVLIVFYAGVQGMPLIEGVECGV